MNMPKVKFTHIPLSKEIDWIHGFLFQNEWGWSKYIIKKHPKIKKVFSFKTEAEQVKFLRNYIIQFKKDNQKLIEKNKTEYQKAWKKIEKEFFITLSEIIQTNWPKNRKTIKAMVSINPICPRFLNDWSFSIFYNYKKNLMRWRLSCMNPAISYILKSGKIYTLKWIVKNVNHLIWNGI